MKALTVLLALLLVFASGGASGDHRPADIVSRADAERVILQRDGLISAQEAVMNVYRCELGRDTQLVPGGCPAPIGEVHTVPVYMCSPPGVLTSADVKVTVSVLNSRVTPFFLRESSAMAVVSFTEGTVIAPPGDDGHQTLGSLDRDGITDIYEMYNASPCYRQAWQHAKSTMFLLFMMPDRQAGTLAGGAFRGGPTLVDMGAYGGFAHEGLWTVVAHEIGHALFDWDHTDLDGCRSVWLLMNSHDAGCLPQNVGDTPLADYQTDCQQRASVNWPSACSAPPPEPTPTPVPALPVDEINRLLDEYGRLANTAGTLIGQINYSRTLGLPACLSLSRLETNIVQRLSLLDRMESLYAGHEQDQAAAIASLHSSRRSNTELLTSVRQDRTGC